MLDILLKWCKDHGIWIDPRLYIRHNETGTAVYTMNQDIPHSASLVHIPKSCVLSAKSCAVSSQSVFLYGHEAQYTLSLALYFELLKGESSRWFGYLQSLPHNIVDLPIFWTHTTLAHSGDGQEGTMWLRGTEVLRHLQRTPENSIEAVADYYYNVAEPTLKQLLLNEIGMSNTYASIQGFYHAYSLVSSRAFFVDAYHGLAMVPVADAFNHAQENHIHLQSEFSVCPHCGSLHECTHDRDGDSAQLPDDRLTSAERPVFHGEELDDVYEMVSNMPIPAHTQIFNTYGEGLSNAQLLSQYGFTLDANENDHLSWNPTDVFQLISSRNDDQVDSGRTPLVLIWKELLLGAMGNGFVERISDSQLVYFPSEPSTQLCLDSDGKISYPLWVLLTLPSINRVNSNTTFLLEALSELLDYQLTLENVVEIDENDVTQAAHQAHPLASVAAALAHRIITLCGDRKAKLGKVGAGDADLGGILDVLPNNMPRTKQAISIVMSERSILDSCESGWTDVFNLTFITCDGGVR
ncbi:hypothetical protein BDZ94DRAFT_1297791 [Collybia nuda]|uniref:SET domain-containing protein n=1 Tax=Collybia nuda TaxID=64659 RepID=A0A9P5Y7G6_9AGAR|nr:hypothetical protein BDZ94DRAFT_1297791 [Collybia nuda]